MQKKDYNPLLSNCDNLIEETITLSILKEIGLAFKQGLMLMVERYVSIPGLIGKLKEFFNVLKHPYGGHTNKIWEAKLEKSIDDVRSSFDNINSEIAYVTKHPQDQLDVIERFAAKTENVKLAKEVADLRRKVDNSGIAYKGSGEDRIKMTIDHIRGLDETTEKFAFHQGVGEIKNGFRTAAINQINQNSAYDSLVNWFHAILVNDTKDLIQQIKSEGVHSLLSSYPVKMGAQADTSIAAMIEMSIFGTIASKVYSYFKNDPDPVIQNVINTHNLVSEPIIEPMPTPKYTPTIQEPHPALDLNPIDTSYSNVILAGGLAAGGLAGYALYKHLKNRKSLSF